MRIDDLRMAVGRQQRGAERLDLKGTGRLPGDAGDQAMRRHDQERDRDQSEDRGSIADCARLSVSDRPDDRRRHEHDRPQLGGDRRTEERPAEPVAAVDEGNERGGRQERRPEVESREDQRACEHRRKRDVESRAAARERDDPDEPDAAYCHRPGEGRRVVAADQRWQHECGQRPWRVLDGEVTVRNEPGLDRVAVALVGRPVDEGAVRPEPPVHKPPRDEEERRGRERDGDAIVRR